MKTYSTDQLGAVQKAWVASNLAAARTGMHDAAHRAKALYVRTIHTTRAVDTGAMANAFSVTVTPTGAELTNATGYFPVIDAGRRPGAAGPPFAAILSWVLRKRLVTGKSGKGRTRADVLKSPDLAKEARNIAFLIRRSIQRKGIKPRQIASGPVAEAAVLELVKASVNEQIVRSGGKLP